MENNSKISLVKWTLLIVLGSILFVFLYTFSQISLFIEFNPFLRMSALLACSALLVFCYYRFERVYRKSNPEPVGVHLALPGLGKHTGKGMVIGFGYFVILACVMMSAGCYRVTEVQFPWIDLLVWLCGYLVVAIGEEIIFRGIIFRLIDERWNFWVALIISGLIFGFVHQMEENATVWSSIAISIEAGLLLGAAYKCSGNLWLPIGIHWAWNYTQGCILGCGVSGKMMGPRIITPEISGSDLITGGAFGPEASIPAVIVGLAISCYLIYKVRLTAAK